MIVIETRFPRNGSYDNIGCNRLSLCQGQHTHVGNVVVNECFGRSQARSSGNGCASCGVLITDAVFFNTASACHRQAKPTASSCSGLPACAGRPSLLFPSPSRESRGGARCPAIRPTLRLALQVPPGPLKRLDCRISCSATVTALPPPSLAAGESRRAMLSEDGWAQANLALLPRCRSARIRWGRGRLALSFRTSVFIPHLALSRAAPRPHKELALGKRCSSASAVSAGPTESWGIASSARADPRRAIPLATCSASHDARRAAIPPSATIGCGLPAAGQR